MAKRIHAERRLLNTKRAADRVGGFMIAKYRAIDLGIGVEAVPLISAP